ncbi:N-acetylmuramoyl-L-alanine amidase [Rheinheimera riviphila]|uniref:N-acetylmuramoyl-L-alanine amidase n=1 Tax=Rheinheimera riviphila TaxID=1834037 RepID=A0A437QSU2_9GAMM|nr:N-acetylmuramoyl-L-alanine amidase [Rheinheimera riviphila]RVU37562.1 N-acetylmuramoyl-L-alanine amidase [Rheinheimera riviphila]
MFRYQPRVLVPGAQNTVGTMFWHGSLAALLFLVGGCSQTPYLQVDQQYQSANRNDRVRFVVIHYTAGNWQHSLDILTKPNKRPVSSHYLIPQSGDKTYPADQALKVYQLVPEQQRAWHAGGSQWEDRSGLNDHSIGIELVNESWCGQRPNRLQQQAELCVAADFDPAQLQLLLGLLKDILARNTDITPTRVLGHSDIVPLRKQDPGIRFPWQWLAANGVGAWYDAAVMQRYWQQLPALPEIKTVQRALKLYGYGIQVTGEHDVQSRAFLLAFQRHFVPEQLTGEPDLKTIAVLWALLEKYFPKALQQESSLQLLPPSASSLPSVSITPL